MPKLGWFEHDAGEVWWHDFVEIMKAILESSGVDARQILGIDVSAIGSCILPIDAEGEPLRAGILYGIDTRADVYRAILESIAYGIRYNIETMDTEGVQAKRMLAVGGGTKNQNWMRIVSDVAGITLHVPEQQIGTGYGDALLAGLGVGVFSDYQDIKKWVKTKHQINPEPGNRSVYDKSYSIFLKLN